MATNKEEILNNVLAKSRANGWNLTEKFLTKHVEKNLPEDLDSEEVTADSVFESYKKTLESCWYAQSSYLAENKPAPQKPPITNPPKPDASPQMELPEDVKEALKYVSSLRKKDMEVNRRDNILKLATKDMTDAQQKAAFEKFLKRQSISGDDIDEEALAKEFVSSYTEMVTELIGDTASLKGGATRKSVEDELAGIGKFKVQ